MTLPLAVPAPQIRLDPPGGPAVLEKAIDLRLPAIAFPDGTPLTGDALDRMGAHLYRGTPGSEEIWNEDEKRWGAPPPGLDGLSALTPLPMQHLDGDPLPWKGLLVATGQKDRNDAPKIAKAIGGSPSYRLRALVRAHHDGAEYLGLSPPSADLVFLSLADTQRFAVSLDTGDAQTCRKVTIQLKDAGLSPVGLVEIHDTGGREVVIANLGPGGAPRARILLLDNGDIQLEPAPGRSIVLAGTLEAQRIDYQPFAGGPRQTL